MKKTIIILVIITLLITGCGSKSLNSSKNTVNGIYSNEIFSNNIFEYKTSYDTATFKFYDDSTFEIIYAGGSTYKGTYEVYNGVNISTKANEIKNDITISYSEQLYIDIINVSNAMMSDEKYVLDTYLLYLKANTEIKNGISKNIDVLQPFLVRYDASLNEGIIVNILGQTQGALILK